MAENQKDNILLRLRRIEGQVRGIQKMIENESGCGEILNQVAAVRSAISQVGIIVFESHARDCIWKAVDEGKNEEVFNDIVTMLGRLIK